MVETSDITGTEQVFICVRYIDDKYITLFFQFAPATGKTGRGLATLTLESLKRFGTETR